jgi:hypothetical protein
VRPPSGDRIPGGQGDMRIPDRARVGTVTKWEASMDDHTVKSSIAVYVVCLLTCRSWRGLMGTLRSVSLVRAA